MSKRGIDIFHDHLAVCRQCREHPFALCAEGFKRLQAAAGANHPMVELEAVVDASKREGPSDRRRADAEAAGI